MSNMSYCQFENTALDLRYCRDWLRENEPESLSENEGKAFRRLVRYCAEIADSFDSEEKP